ncbi:hypothetical protein JHK85_001388 [Glycine max]|nr:hypothetical protein JHK85_001388 [Glycine max]
MFRRKNNRGRRNFEFQKDPQKYRKYSNKEPGKLLSSISSKFRTCNRRLRPVTVVSSSPSSPLGFMTTVGVCHCREVEHPPLESNINASFEAELLVPELVSKEGGPESFCGIFIHAPAILEAGPKVQVLADYPVPSSKLLSFDSSIEDQTVN